MNTVFDPQAVNASAYAAASGTSILGLSQSIESRVCDNCIRRKIKCDLGRPSCSRCLESRRKCAYSNTRKRPGPEKGYRKKAKTDAYTSELQIITTQGTALDLSWTETLDNHNRGSLTNESRPAHAAHSETTRRNNKDVFEAFFTSIHPSIPIFDERKFYNRFIEGNVSIDLVSTINLITGKLLGRGLPDEHQISQIKQLLSQRPLDNDDDSHKLELDDFRQATLLAYFSFHEFPGESGWLRIGQLTRKAYQYGLHQLDSPSQLVLGDGGRRIVEDLDEWRHLWWCIFCLDSYSNITAAMPFVIESESIVTALPVRSLIGPQSLRVGEDASEVPVLMPPDAADLWKTVEQVMSINDARGRDFNMHILTTVLIREAGNLRRLNAQNPSIRLATRFIALGNHVSSVRLAIPPRHLNPSRRTLDDESSGQHHARLIWLLHLEIARMLALVPLALEASEDEFLAYWSVNIEYCESVVSIAKQWNPHHPTNVDPAICFIILKAMVLMQLHKVCSLLHQPDLDAKVQGYIDVLRLFLQQFATTWKLPGMLLCKLLLS